MKRIDTKKLTISAIMIALATVLSITKVWQMPLGGSVTLLSMLPVCLLSIMFGVKWGLCCSFVYGIIQMALSIANVVSWGLTPLALIGTIVFDYIAPYTLLGFSGVFTKKSKYMSLLGIAITVFLRFVCHFTTGVIIFKIWCEWDNVYAYSLAYNGGYMLPELVLTVVGAYFLLLSKPIQNLISKYNS